MFKTYLTRIATEILSPVEYVKARLAEPTTWAGVIGGFSGASALTHPWDILTGICGAIMALLPTSKKKSEAAQTVGTDDDPAA